MIESDDPGADRSGEQEPREVARIEPSPRRGRRLDAWGWLALVLGVVVLGSALVGGVLAAANAADPESGGGFTWALLLQFVLGSGLLGFGLWAVLRGRRHLQRVLPDLGSALAGERIVLFLRSFSDDDGFARIPASRWRRWLVWPPPVMPADVRSEEQQVARGLAPFGRLVALGKPSDRLPRSGAERNYTSDERWQDEVRAALERADLVLVSAGSGEGLRWEVEQAVGRDDPSRLVLVVTHDPQHYADFRNSVGNVFPRGLPDDPRGRSSRARYVRAVVWFERDWTPLLEVLSGRFPLFRSAARTQYALPRALRPVYERAGLSAPGKGSASRTRPRSVPAGVALFSAAWIGVVAVWYCLLSISAAHDGNGKAGDVSPVTFGVAVLVLSVPFAVWMWRVLRGGPVATLMVPVVCSALFSMLLSCVVLVPLVVLGTVMEKHPNLAVVPLMAFEFVQLAVLAVAVPLIVARFLFRREVREWVDSRT